MSRKEKNEGIRVQLPYNRYVDSAVLEEENYRELVGILDKYTFNEQEQ
ncbi:MULTISPECIES: hypothetical protein [Bacillaceae]|uniref:Uncharacterized protein n=1 Tax=Peribacillus huizhouensis TaxID=1501239 RepID=A0ABR6CLI3_9BACI|nr:MULTISPECIES: hypothetical protein [Bacillaceae]MBA9025897.1 hypothetical protein [Peribacillus huizhouensis]